VPTGRRVQTITMRAKTAPEYAEALLLALRALRAETRREAGNVMFDIQISEVDAGDFLLREEFLDDGAVAAHRASEHFAAFKAAMAGFPLVFERYGPVD
jgi:quinol monooxygenase YgiN